MEHPALSPGVGPSRPAILRTRTPRHAQRPAARRLPSEDAYARAMIQGQVQLFMVDANGYLLAPSLPEAYRQALMPAPEGQARQGVAYFDLQPMPVAREPTLWERVLTQIKRAWDRTWAGYRALPGESP